MKEEEFEGIISEASYRSNRIYKKAMKEGRHFMSMLVISPNDPDDGKKMVRVAHVVQLDDEDMAIIDSFTKQLLAIQQKYAKRRGYELDVEGVDSGRIIRSVGSEDPNHSEPSSN